MKILNFGSLNLDNVYQVPHFLQAGETMAALSEAVHPGGKGLNQSLALARAGADVYHAGVVGNGSELLTNLLKENGVEPEVVLYLETPADAATLRDLLKMLGMNSARELMRQKEDLYKELNLADSSLSEEALIQAMVDNPKLMERPIVVANGKARIGRPPEQVLEIVG